MKWFRKRDEDNTESIDVDEAIEKANAAKSRLAISRPRANQMSAFFEARRGKNGFGDDFEWTLDITLDHRPEGAS